MAIYEHLTEFGELNVVDWHPGQPLPDLDTTMVRMALEYDDKQRWSELLAAYLAEPGVERTRGLVVGAYAGEMVDLAPTDAVEALIQASAKLPRLDHLFLNDITSEENEISWITNTDNEPLLRAYPQLRHYGVRGGNELRFAGLTKMAELTHWVVQSGGLSSDVVRDVVQTDAPKLQHLELYLGTDEYGASYTLDDLAPLLQGQSFGSLTYLGLKNAEDQDEVVKAVLASPLVRQLQTLDLSLGVLTDEGGQALLDSALDARSSPLKHVDLSHHFMSDGMVEKLQAWAGERGFTIDLSEQQKNDDYRFVSIGE